MASQALDTALNTGYAQADRLAKLDTPVGKDWLVPLYAKINARLGRNYEVTVDAASTYDTQIKLGALMLQAVTLWIKQTDGNYGLTQNSRTRRPLLSSGDGQISR